MHILVLLAGVADPKWPLPNTFDTSALARHRAAHPVLSPFDEAALELALKWRDADPSTQIHALVGASSLQDGLVRHAAGFRLDRVECLDLTRHPAWQPGRLAAMLGRWVRQQAPRPGLVLIGREFGDEDDGCLPACLAEELGLPMWSQVLALQPREDGARILRQHAGRLEHVSTTLPMLASVTNHSGNRLRHPLMKNVMAAKRASFEMASMPELGDDEPPAIERLCMDAAPADTRARRCQFLEGDLGAQAATLARHLIEEAR